MTSIDAVLFWEFCGFLLHHRTGIQKKQQQKNKIKNEKAAMKNCLDTLGSGLSSRQTADGRRGGRARWFSQELTEAKKEQKWTANIGLAAIIISYTHAHTLSLKAGAVVCIQWCYSDIQRLHDFRSTGHFLFFWGWGRPLWTPESVVTVVKNPSGPQES